MNILPTSTVFLVGVSLVAISGCTSQSAHLTTILPRTSGAISVRQTDAFRRAAALYKAKEYAAALRQVNDLLRITTDETDRRYLLRQQAICQAALSGKPAPTIPSASLASPRKTVASTTTCGPRALLLVCNKLGVPANFDTLCRVAKVNQNGTTLAHLQKAAQSVGLKASGVQMDAPALQKLKTPAVAWVDGSHYVVLLSVQKDILSGEYSATVHDPSHNAPETISLPELLSRGGGILLTLEKERG